MHPPEPCFYLSALLTAADQIQQYLSAGTPVVVESYFARCLADHRAFGTRLSVPLPAGLPRPVTHHLGYGEDERHRSLAGREKPVPRGDALAEITADEITDACSLCLVADAPREHHRSHP
ncbi:hypothetical protein OG909_17095 [Streptomyces sp. NBC_01754]|uniref:hypothetical protein n=1 Tax=Streptomyces sp. NBC_01754 TaxID=2975930 RepID=UPI002DD8BB86|nr:hypothetical protein [Streptomyces sp. NBC_01754]WSC93847.1 hypothetical protein OG909_17095 [Streptomyces sp. NBC_01754]